MMAKTLKRKKKNLPGMNEKIATKTRGPPNPSDHQNHPGSLGSDPRSSPPIDGESVDLERSLESVLFIIIQGDSYAPRPRLGHHHHHRRCQDTLCGQQGRRVAGYPPDGNSATQHSRAHCLSHVPLSPPHTHTHTRRMNK